MELTDEVLGELADACNYAETFVNVTPKLLAALIAAAKRCQWHERIIETHAVMPVSELGAMLEAAGMRMKQ